MRFLFAVAVGVCAVLSAVVAEGARPGLYGISDLAAREVIHIDVDAMVATHLGPHGADIAYAGLAYDPGSDRMYAVSGSGRRALYLIDTENGAASVIGDHGIRYIGALAFDSRNSVLYGASTWDGNSPALYRLDVETGDATRVGDTGASLEGLAYDVRRDRLVGVQPHGGARLLEIFEVDRSTGATSLIATSGHLNSCGFAHDPDRDLFWANDATSRALFSYDPTNCFAWARHVPTGADLGQFIGLAYVPVPESTTLLLLGLGGLAVIRRRRTV